MDNLPDAHMRRVRNIDFCSQELRTLLPGRTCKLTGTTIDAYAAVVQDVSERSATGADFVLFSSWIPAIASGLVRDGGFEGSIRDHVLAAVSSNSHTGDTHLLTCWQCPQGNTDIANYRVRWGIPLCGGSPSHWVFGWIDHREHEYGIVDSMPHLNSRSWAEQVNIPAASEGPGAHHLLQYLRAAVDAICCCTAMADVSWDTYSFTVRTPPAGDRQVDSWACGLFVMIAMQVFADRWTQPLLGESAKEAVRAGALRALLGAP